MGPTGTGHKRNASRSSPWPAYHIRRSGWPSNSGDWHALFGSPVPTGLGGQEGCSAPMGLGIVRRRLHELVAATVIDGPFGIESTTSCALCCPLFRSASAQCTHQEGEGLGSQGFLARQMKSSPQGNPLSGALARRQTR